MFAVTPIKRRDILVLVLVLLIAAWMRLGRGDIVEYFHDDAMLATLALEMVDGERFPLTGILSSTGIPNPPTSVYVMAIPFSFSPDPHIAIYVVMILNVLGVGLLWLIAHRYFGRRAGWIASFLYAINPWAVLFSRKIWAQDFHTPFILLGIFLLIYGYWEASKRADGKISLTCRLAQIFSIPILIFAFQIHFASWALVPIVLVVLWVGRHRIRMIESLLAIILSFVMLAPYLFGLSQTLTQDPTRISDAAGRSSVTNGIGFSPDSLIDTVYLASGTGLETWVAPDQQLDLLTTYTSFMPLSFVLILFLICGLWTLWRTYRMFTVLMLVWAFLPQVALVINWTPVYIHYFIPSIPALTLLTAIGICSFLLHVVSYRWIYRITCMGLLGIGVLQIVTWHQTLNYLETEAIPYPGFTTPIGYLNDIRDTLDDSNDVLIVSQGMSWNLHHEVAVWDTLLWKDVRCVRTVLGDGYAVFPAQPFRVVIAPDAPSNPIDNLYQTDSPIIFETRQNGHNYAVYEWESSPEWDKTPIESIQPTSFDNGVILSGYAIANNQVYLEWRLPAQDKAANFQYSAQIFDPDNNRIAQLDKTFWHGRHWCQNDRLITWGALPIDGVAHTLKIGLYRLGTGVDVGQFFNANVLDELGNPIGQSVDIPLSNTN